jgi:hypothetical protein
MVQPKPSDVKQDLVDVINLPQFRGFWVEYGVIEWAYASGPGKQDFLSLLESHWHIVQEARGGSKGVGKSISQYLANPLLSQLATAKRVRLYPDKKPGTGFWDRSGISWWASIEGPDPDWYDPATRLSWESNLENHPDANPHIYVP